MIKEKRSWFQIGVLKERVAIQLDRRPKTEYRKPAPKPRGCPLSLNNKGATLVGSFRLRSSVFGLFLPFGKTKTSSLHLALGILLLLLSFSCKEKNSYEKPIDLSTYQVEPGFKLEVMASEPLLKAPIAMDFDLQGRMWVLELPGYMANIDGAGEEDPTGSIVILNDRDGNGRMDESKIFLDKLVAPRTLLLAYNGLLYAEPPNLWFVEIENDKPGKKILVDTAYVLTGNIEHQANGLTMNIDNWIYSSRSNARYQRKNGNWIKEQTAHRGQWGLTKDPLGRLFYNDNSNQFQGDLVLPMMALNNPWWQPKHSIRQQIATDQRMYPLHAAIINRGYVEGSLDEAGKPLRITSACGPVIYQGDLFPADYNGNSFVCLPEGNIIKRNILEYEGTKISATPAWENKEFIASTDVAFRPVNLYNGPEGAMYIVDLHKGVIQHRAYMSPYLREKIEELKLDTIVGYGRILRVFSEGDTIQPIPVFDIEDVADLVQKLKSPNVWVRDKAQQTLVQNELRTALGDLVELVVEKDFSIGQMHALWILKEWDGLSLLTMTDLLENTNPHLCGLAFSFLENSERKKDFDVTEKANELKQRKNPELDAYLIASLGKMETGESVFQFYKNMSRCYKESELMGELAVSALSGKEAAFYKFEYQRIVPDSHLWSKLFAKTIANKKENKPNKEMLPAVNNPYGDKRQRGLELYRQYCSVCHGEAGGGTQNLAPPLDGSEYITGSTERLALIMLHGMQGPIHINGKRYEFNAAMPGIGNNPAISNKDVLSIILFLRNAFSTEGTSITEERIATLRELKPKDGTMYTEELLNDFKQLQY